MYIPDFDRAWERTKPILLDRYQDYGVENIIEAGQHGVAERLKDKISRIQTLCESEAVKGESIEDTWIDIIGYGAIGWLLSQNMWASPDESSQEIRWVFLGGPIDCNPQQDHPWRKKIREQLLEIGFSTYDPESAFRWYDDIRNAENVEQATDMITTLNWAALERCDAVIVNVIPNVRSIGTGRELERALQDGKPVVAITRPDNCSIYLQDVDYQACSVEDAVEYVEKRWV